MAPKKIRKQAQETMLEEPVEDQIVPSKSIAEEEPRTQEDQDEPELGGASLTLFKPFWHSSTNGIKI
jgi:hypothetical protein